MKMYLNKLNKRIDCLVDAIKTAESMMSKMGDQNEIRDQINKRKHAKPGASKKGDGEKKENKSIADVFKESLNSNKTKF